MLRYKVVWHNGPEFITSGAIFCYEQWGDNIFKARDDWIESNNFEADFDIIKDTPHSAIFKYKDTGDVVGKYVLTLWEGD